MQSVWWLILGLSGMGAPTGDHPYVEIARDTGSVRGPSKTEISPPRWEHVQIELLVENRLTQSIRQLELSLVMVHTPLNEPIPGWSFVERASDVTIPAQGKASLQIRRTLPPRRTSPPAHQIAYRVRLKSYLLDRPQLDTAMMLLGSRHPSDQESALRSYERAPEAMIETLSQELATELVNLPSHPTANEALRMLFSIRALGALGTSDRVSELLSLPDRIPRGPWGRAVIDLAEKMIEASQPNDPRLGVFPKWARERTALLNVRAEDVVAEVVQDTLFEMGDPAVPDLLSAAHSTSPGVRKRARQILQDLGRSTPRSQLQLARKKDRLRVIEVLGRLDPTQSVPALIELLHRPNLELQRAAQQALEQIGAAAVAPLIDSLATHDIPASRQTILSLAKRAPEAWSDALRTVGIISEDFSSDRERLEAARNRLSAKRKAQQLQVLEEALRTGNRGAFSSAFLSLERLSVDAPELYAKHAPAIARLHFDRADALWSLGDYQAAAKLAEQGIRIADHPRGHTLLAKAHIALLQGYVQLDDLERARAFRARIPANHVAPELSQADAELALLETTAALDRGDVDQARIHWNQAQGAAATSRYAVLQRRLFWVEHAATLGLAAVLSGLAFIIGMGWRHRRRTQRRLELHA